jgi:hypothetical protein
MTVAVAPRPSTFPTAAPHPGARATSAPRPSTRATGAPRPGTRATGAPRPGTGPGTVPHGGARPGGLPRPLPPGAVATPAPGEAELVVRRFAVACVEVLNGFRPLAHLRRVVEPRRFEPVATGLRGRCAPPGRPAGDPAARIHIRRIRVCEPARGVAEASVVFGQDGLAWAMALRFERREGRWLCTIAHTLG